MAGTEVGRPSGQDLTPWTPHLLPSFGVPGFLPLDGPSGPWRDDLRLVLASALWSAACRAGSACSAVPALGRTQGPSAPPRLFVACQLHANLAPVQACRSSLSYLGIAEHHSINTNGLWAKSIWSENLSSHNWSYGSPEHLAHRLFILIVLPDPQTLKGCYYNLAPS